MTNQVYYDPNLGKTVEVGSPVELTGDEARHAHVKRVTPGEVIDVVNGAGTRATIRVASASPTSLVGTAESVSHEERGIAITLVQALAKGGRDESAIEAAIEVGVNGIVAWQADRSIVRWSGPKADKGIAKWEQLGLAAMKQSRQSHLPTVSGPYTSKQLTQAIADTVQDGGRVLLCQETATTRLAGLEFDPTDRVWIIVGPEGGISEVELDSFVRAGGEPVLLGDNVLRSGTAGTVAATVVNVLSGSWR
ncbi:16S rRNA (uracil(1498)-N(3))-methyltransferase [Flaviflexus massiliensis]|uniref:16S rRNA (uracil(1498)-N(3))-methyltransferase n=1 Tax=Flaviflexus massiliensis TaxID=1522309 RepID=UPI0006D58E2E|nr:16S rRNA (uracil(1498)-N(3))-methyltransferase [Flaviflexus massiliensis]